MSKASTTIRMPSDLDGPDKFNPCLDCLESWDGWCGKYKTWGFKVKERCIKERSGKVEAGKHAASNQPRAFMCKETGELFHGLAEAVGKTGQSKQTLSNWLRTGKRNKFGHTYVFVGKDEKENG